MYHFYKRTISLALTLLILVSLCGCSENEGLSNALSYALGVTDTSNANDNTSEGDNAVQPGMEYLGYSAHNGSSATFYYYRDTITDVMYVLFREKDGYAGMGGLTVMLDPENGLPLTFVRWQEIYNQKSTEVHP